MNPKAQKPVLDPDAPAQASLSILAVRRPGSLFGSAPERASPPNSPPHGPKASATLMFRGPSWAGSLFRGLSPWGGNHLPQKRAPALPAPLADWSGTHFAASSPREAVQLRTSFHRLPAEIGPSVACRTFLPLPALRGGGDFRPDHNWKLHNESESRQAENEPPSLWITGILRITRDSRGGISPNVTSRGPNSRWRRPINPDVKTSRGCRFVLVRLPPPRARIPRPRV